MWKIKIVIIKAVHLSSTILGLSKIMVCEFWCDYIKGKHGKKAKLCYINTDSFTIHIITKIIYQDISKGMKK